MEQNPTTSNKNTNDIIVTDGIDAGRINDIELARIGAIAEDKAREMGRAKPDHHYGEEAMIQEVWDEWKKGTLKYNGMSPKEFFDTLRQSEKNGIQNRAKEIARQIFSKFEALDQEAQNQLMQATTEEIEQVQIANKELAKAMVALQIKLNKALAMINDPKIN